MSTAEQKAKKHATELFRGLYYVLDLFLEEEEITELERLGWKQRLFSRLAPKGWKPTANK